jgi:hypothetical protein
LLEVRLEMSLKRLEKGGFVGSCIYVSTAIISRET